MPGKNTYEIVDDGKIFSFKPNRYSMKLSVWVLAVILLLAIIFVIFFHHINRGWGILLGVLGPYLILHSLYDIFIRAEINYVFDREARIVFRKIPLSPMKAIMSFEEMVIFTSTAHRYWHYALGAKKNHLVKNYRISEDFKESKEKSFKEIEYEKAILSKLYKITQIYEK